LDDLKDILQQVRENKERIKIVSSMEEAKKNTGVLISLKNFSTLRVVNLGIFKKHGLKKR
jgi:hypothetical protein